jgi:hypothetical protein
MQPLDNRRQQNLLRSRRHLVETLEIQRFVQPAELSILVPREVSGRLRVEDDDREEEADETLYWLEVLSDAGIVKASTVADLLDEADQLVRIFVASINTARGSRR